MWDELSETYDKINGSVIFNLHYKINTISQSESKLSDYYHKLNSLWREYDAMVQLPVCTCDDASDYKDHAQLLKLMQFVMGLNDVYAPIRSTILTTEPLPTVKEAFSLLSRDESHRTLGGLDTGTGAGTSHTLTSEQYHRLMSLLSDSGSRNGVQNNVACSPAKSSFVFSFLSSRLEGSGNEAHANDTDIRPIYDKEPMAKVQTTTEINVFATGQQHTEQPEFNNEGEVDQNADQYHDKCPLPAKLTDNQKNELSYQSLESENICLKKTVAQFQKDFLRMEAHCVNLELKYQKQALKEGQHGQFSNVKSNEAKVKHDIDVIETINIELEHKVAKLFKENETLKRHYKELSDSIKTTRAKTIEHITSLIAQNAEFKAQLQEKGFAIAALKNELIKLTRNTVNTKFIKSSILGKPVLQPHRNQSVVRQPTAFKSERPRILKPRFASQVDVNNDLSKPVTTHYLPKERKSVVAKPHHTIAPGSSRYSSNDVVHNHYLEEAKKKTQESSRNSEPSVMPSARSQSTANGSKPKPRINNQKSRNWPAYKSSCIMTKTVPLAEHSRNSRNFSDSKHFVCSTCQKCVFNANHDSCVTKLLNEVNSRAKTGRIFKTVGRRWVPTGKIFTSSTTKVDNEPTNGSNKDITNQYECEQTLDVSAGTLNLSAGIMPTKIELTPEQSQQSVSNDVLAVFILINGEPWLYGGGGIPFQLKSDSLPHAHAQTTKTYYKHQDSRIKKAQELKTKTSANSDIQDLPSRYQVYQGRLLASFQDDAKYEHVGQDTRSQGGKDDQD
ncbi:hypothetical protein Tco_1216213 [Tanacetum coccineum]